MERYLGEFPLQQVNISDSRYPASLKKISDPPPILYYRGRFLDKNESCFAIVGTRHCSDYGKEVAFNLASDLTKAGLTIVSGLALGIDSWAHKGALESNRPLLCRTVAVLGTGLDEATFYPQENLKLAKQILKQGGCLISELAKGIAGTHFTFPRRNRIIAAISLGVLVVEAKLKSGSLITAGWAKKYHKPIFSVPGSIHSQNSKGCHLLIKQGSHLAESASDILEVLGLRKNSLALDFNEATSQNPTENLVLKILQAGSQPIDKIIELSGLPASQVSACLSQMELEGQVKNLGANIYALKR